MAKTLDLLSAQAALVEAARHFHQRGWMLGTAGNLSARDSKSKNILWITGSGLPKGNLEESDFLEINIDNGKCNTLTHLKPSAETAIHQVIYQHFPHANCCMHVHSVDAALATERHGCKNYIELPTLEMLKGFGIWEEQPVVHLPVFTNHLDVGKIAKDINQHLKENETKIDALMIRNHGITVWGSSIQETYNRVELLEFIMNFLARK